MSSSTTRDLISMKERGAGAVGRIFCQWQGSVVRTFDSYEKNVLRRYGRRQCGYAIQDSLFPKLAEGGLHYAYLFSIQTSRSVRLYKVGVSSNVCKRFDTFRHSFPAVFKAQAVRVAVVDCETWSEQFERSVLLACHNLWVGGEWLREKRKATAASV